MGDLRNQYIGISGPVRYGQVPLQLRGEGNAYLPEDTKGLETYPQGAIVMDTGGEKS